ncbi:MAG: hypothetical protein CFE24_10915 [Flavobacterium sp. BFFFF2]|nr:MAG: hypothetical protein CFE24_10915 [Flavobacterium sp. BFFFF2]
MNFFSLLFLLFITHIGFTQSKEQRYTVKWVNAANGLKQQSVRYCVSDNYGFVWIATELGLFRYDGVNLLEIKDNRYPSLSTQRIPRLGKDEVTGKIYFQTSPEDCQYLIDKNSIERIAPEKNGEKAIITYNNFCYTASNPLVKKVLEQKKAVLFIKEYSTLSSLTACATSNFLYLPQYGHLLIFDKNGRIIKDDYSFSTSLELMQFGNKVLAFEHGKISLINNGEISSDKIQVDAIIQKYIDRNVVNQSNIEILGSNNRYYIKYNRQIFQIRFKNNTLTTQFLFKAPAEDITSITFSEKENLYFIGTNTQGMAVLKPILFNTIQLDENKSNKSINYCYAVAEVSSNKWYSSSGWTFNPINQKSVIDNFLIDNRNIRFILHQKDKFYINAKNNLWNIATHKNDYDFKYPVSKKEEFAGFSGYAYHKDQLYLTDNNAIYFSKVGAFITDTIVNKKFKERQINGICSFNSKLIIPTSKGVYDYLPNTMNVAVVKGLEKVNARYIKPINRESYWVGCYGEGLFLVANNKVYKVTDATIDLTTAHAIEEDKSGNLWISTNDGLLATNKREAFDKIRNKQPINCYKYSTDDGLLTNEFNGGGTHPSLHTKNGIIGFPSMKGFVWFEPNEVKKQLFKSTLVMDNVLADGQICIPQNKRYEFAATAELATFNFSYPYFYDRDNLTVEYKCTDETGWKPIKGNTLQLARSVGGERLLQIRISTHGFDTTKSVIKTFPLNFELRYYEKAWFWTFVASMLVLLLLISYRIGLYFHKERERKLREKIDEKTAELYINIIQLEKSTSELESSRGQLSRSLQEKEILIKEIHHRVKNNLQIVMNLLKIQARESTEAIIDEFVKKGLARILTMSLIHENLYANEQLDKIDLKKYIIDLVTNLKNVISLENDDIALNLDVDAIHFDIENAVPLGLIINELLTNSFKHAFKAVEKGVINIRIKQTEEGTFEFTYSDNGPGFDLDKSDRKTLGLELVHQLTRQLNGSIQTETGKSNSITISFQTNE